MRSWLAVLMLSALLLLVAACDDDDATDDAPADDAVAEEVQPTATPEPEPTETPAPTATPEPEPTATPEPTPEPEPTEVEDTSDSDRRPAGDLEGLLLSLDDLPDGWTQLEDEFADEDFGDVSDDPFEAPCGIEMPEDGFESIAEADREFEGTELGPFLSQSLMQMASVDDADAAMNLLRELFGCDEWTEVDDFGDEMTFTIEIVPIDGVGDDAFRIELGLSFGEEMPELDMFGDFKFDLVMLRRGEYVTMLMFFDIFGVSAIDFDSIVQIADEKLQGAS
jgi:hypothetical protein